MVLLQTVVYVLAGAGKAYIHMDEAYSLGLMQYHQVELTAEPDFYNHWHRKAYFQDYLAVQADERGDFAPVYENQKNDVHPPLFYLLLRVATEILAPSGEFSRWPGIILNIMIAAVNTVIVWTILNKLFIQQEKGEIKALILTAVTALTIAAVSAVVYIRMYMLLALMVSLTIWLHLKLWDEQKPRVQTLVGIGAVALIGVLTQYYYLFFLAPLWLVMAWKDGREGRWRDFGKYTAALVGAGALSLLIWPYAIQHMFFGYRGQGVLASLTNLPRLASQIGQYILVADYHGLHRLGLVLAVGAVGLAVLIWWRKRSEVGAESRSKSSPWLLILWPTVGYFLIVAAVSPFIELRYIMPVMTWVTVLVIVGIYRLMRRVWSAKVSDWAIGGVLIMMLLAAPVQLKLGWMRIELLYRDRQAVMSLVEKVPDAPLLYFITSENNRFLDNILPFAQVRESYLALDLLEPTAVEVREILQGKDLGSGLIVFVSGSQNQEQALAAVQAATGLTQVDWIQGINTCDVYYLQ